MHPAPSLLEAPPLRDEQRPAQQRPMSADSGSMGTDRGRTPSTPTSPHMRLDAASSTSPTMTTVTTGSAVATTSIETGGDSSYSTGDSASPTFSPQTVFSVRDGTDVATVNRPTRRRTGPLSASQREKAALIRKLGACVDCRRRRVACHPNHHNMSWADAVRKYKPHSPTQEYVTLAGRPISPARQARSSFGQSDAQDMEIDTTPTPAPTTPHQLSDQQIQQQTRPQNRISSNTRPQAPSLPLQTSRRLSVGSEARMRTPLPSGRGHEKLPSAGLPGIESLSGDLQNAAARIINSTNPHRTRYDAVQVMILLWSDDSEEDVQVAIDDLKDLLENKYSYAVDVKTIPHGAQSPYRWLLQTVTTFINNRDSRDALKILYYTGFSYMDASREMVLASSMDRTLAQTTIRWSGIQQVLEDASSDTLVLMDAAFYPCSKMTRREGVLEVIAASAGEDPRKSLGRVAFTRAVTHELQTRLTQKFRGPLSAFSVAELHVRLMSKYPRIVEERSPDKEQITSFPSPLHIQISSNARLPSILLAPDRKPLPSSPDVTVPSGSQLNLTLRLADNVVDKAGWSEWMRLLPEGVREVRCEAPFRTTYR